LSLSSYLPWLAVVTGLAAVACGPSFQAVYEGDVRFEHCYALDQGPASAEIKKECWQGWLHDYTYGQSRDRVEYAGTRYSELSLDQSLPTEDREVKRAPMASPVPTSAFAPPPSVAAERVTAEATASAPNPAVEHPVAAARAPGEECAEGCSGYWKTCKSSCKGAACDACDKAYKLCGTGCFKK
jgi:hypothetical protein